MFYAGFGMGIRFFLPRKDAAALVCCGNKQGAYGLMRRGLGERVILGCFKRLELGRLFKEEREFEQLINFVSHLSRIKKLVGKLVENTFCSIR